MEIKTYALVRDSSGAPDIISETFTVSEELYSNGHHYDMIETVAVNNNYEFIAAFDENDPAAAFCNFRNKTVHVAMRLDGEVDAIAFADQAEGKRFVEAHRHGHTLLLETGIYGSAEEAWGIFGENEGESKKVNVLTIGGAQEWQITPGLPTVGAI